MEHPPQRSKKKPESLSARGRALRLLARREYTRRELAAKLAPHVPAPEELEALLDDFTERGWLSEARVVEQVVNAKRARLGPARIRRALLERGVSEELIAPAPGQHRAGTGVARRVRKRAVPTLEGMRPRLVATPGCQPWFA